MKSTRASVKISRHRSYNWTSERAVRRWIIKERKRERGRVRKEGCRDVDEPKEILIWSCWQYFSIKFISLLLSFLFVRSRFILLLKHAYRNRLRCGRTARNVNSVTQKQDLISLHSLISNEMKYEAGLHETL